MSLIHGNRTSIRGVLRMGMPSSMRLRRVGFVLAVAGVLAGSLRVAATTAGERWVGTWAAAPQSFMPGSLETFDNQTVRLVVHTSIGGSKIRIRFSNIYGSKALTLGAVHVAHAGNGVAILPGTDRAVTFEGKATVTIGAQLEATSDPVNLEIPASSALAITMFFLRQSEATTSHFLALQTGYVSPRLGNVTGAERFRIERTLNSWPFVTAVEVQARSDAAAIVVFGDSIVDGDGSTPNSNQRWPDLLWKRLLVERAAGSYLGVLNEGLIGNRLLVDSPHDSEFGDVFGEAGLARFTRDVLDQPGVTTTIVRIGGNDIGLPGALVKDAKPVSAESLIEGYRKLVSLAHARGVRVIGTTISPSEGATLASNFYTPDKDAVRQKVNAWLREQREFDGIVDLDRVLRDPAHPSRLLPVYDSGDHVHPNDAGYAASADALDLSLLRAK